MSSKKEYYFTQKQQQLSPKDYIANDEIMLTSSLSSPTKKKVSYSNVQSKTNLNNNKNKQDIENEYELPQTPFLNINKQLSCTFGDGFGEVESKDESINNRETSKSK